MSHFSALLVAVLAIQLLASAHPAAARDLLGYVPTTKPATTKPVATTSPCSPDPCLHGSVCKPIYGSTGYTCVNCPPGYSGKNCNIPVDTVTPNPQTTKPHPTTTAPNVCPCLNGGTCVGTYGTSSYICKCPSGYTGPNCGTPVTTAPVTTAAPPPTTTAAPPPTTTAAPPPTTTAAPHPCNPNPCLNGGSCVATYGNSYTCTCKAGYTGSSCGTPAVTTPVPTSTPKPTPPPNTPYVDAHNLCRKGLLGGWLQSGSWVLPGWGWGGLNPPPYPALPPMVYHPELAGLAQSWADHLAAGGGSLSHNPSPYIPSVPGASIGENLATYKTSNPGDGPDASKVTGGWAAERSFYALSTNTCNTPGGLDNTCVNYKQIVSRQTMHMGCGASRCAKAADGSYTWVVVCNYLNAAPSGKPY